MLKNLLQNQRKIQVKNMCIKIANFSNYHTNM